MDDLDDEHFDYEVDWTTGPNHIGYYSGTVTVYAKDDEQAAELGERKARRDLCWGSRLRVTQVRRLHD